ncbi:MAG: S8 family serine peptidase, partial [Acidobacteria bacterium]|nr:S8 family serine peptidase [Acidobacteriota bacterium]
MRQIQDRSTRWVLLSLFLAVILLVFTWQSNPSTTTAGTNPVVLKTEPVASQDASLQPEFSSSAGLDGVRSQDLLASLSHKLSPALRDQISFLLSNPQLDHEIPVIVRVNPDLWAQNAELEGNEFSKGNNKALSLIHSYMTRLPAAQIKLLLESGAIEYITIDAPIRVVEPVTMDAPGGALASSHRAEPNQENRNPFLAAIGADQLKGYTGKGVTVAVFDSGISRHPDLDPSRILAAVDLTSGTAVLSEGHSDQYGHGTAVAGIVGGTGQASGGAYAGPAPGVSFVDLKVVGDDGSGLTSNLIQAIAWVIENKDLYDIRVANFSVGHPPLESYTTDPLNQAVRKLVESGVVTVASSGNLGKASEY